MGADGPADAPPRAVTETVESSLTVSLCPSGQRAGADDSAIGRFTSKVLPQARQRYSYRGMKSGYDDSCHRAADR